MAGTGKQRVVKMPWTPSWPSRPIWGRTICSSIPGKMFPEKYKNGAFIAFHNQSPELKKGFFVAFIPFKDGKPIGDWEIFADDFAGIDLADPNGALQHRPCGLAQGPDGELYVSDDLGGTVFKITY